MIRTSIENGVASVILDSPSTANALTPAAFAELLNVLNRWEQPDSGARVLVLRGGPAGAVFSAGANLDVLGVSDPEQLARQIVDALAPIQRILFEGRLPTIAAVNGPAIGGAAGLALWCDMVVAAHSARFSFSFAKLGLIPDTGLTFTLQRLVGTARARAWLMSAADISAQEAESSGMIYRAVADEQFDQEVQNLSLRLSRMPQESFLLTRQAMTEAQSRSLTEQIAVEARLQAGRVMSDEFKAAIAQFSAKRGNHR